MRRAQVLATIGLATLALAGRASAVEPSVALADVKLGEHWFGPEYSSDDLKGRVVLFEIWGFN